MWRDFIMAVLLTVVFSVGVGVMFVRTILEMFDLMLQNRESLEKQESARTQRSPKS